VRLAVYHNQPSGGARRALYELGLRMAANHEIDVYTLSTAEQTLLNDSDWARSVHVRPFQPRRPIRMGLYLNELREWQDLREMDSSCAEIAREIDSGGYDVVLADVCRMTQAPDVLAHLRTPSAYYCHEPPRRFLEAACRPDAAPLSLYERARNAWHRPVRSMYERAAQKLDRRNVRRAGAVLTNSEYSRDSIRSYYGRDSVVCRLGVDAKRFSPGGERGDYVLSVGAFEPHKGFDFLVGSVARMPAEARPPLVLAGNSDDAGIAADLQRMASGLGVRLTTRVRISDEDLTQLYRGARAFVYAPHNEPFGLAALEAMACGVPVVAVAEGGPLESVVDGVTGVLSPRDESAFAGALAAVLGDEARRQRMGAAGRQRVEHEWTWEAAARRVEAQLAVLAGAKAAVGA
jgi:glycosyltransferase involved in cell wall biosynthesis